MCAVITSDMRYFVQERCDMFHPKLSRPIGYQWRCVASFKHLDDANDFILERATELRIIDENGKVLV